MAAVLRGFQLILQLPEKAIHSVWLMMSLTESMGLFEPCVSLHVFLLLPNCFVIPCGIPVALQG